MNTDNAFALKAKPQLDAVIWGDLARVYLADDELEELTSIIGCESGMPNRNVVVIRVPLALWGCLVEKLFESSEAG